MYTITARLMKGKEVKDMKSRTRLEKSLCGARPKLLIWHETKI